MPKIYVGKGKLVGQYGNIAMSICLDQIQPHAFEFKGRNFVKLIISEMKNPDEHGKTHTVYIDDFKPDPSKRRTPQTHEEQLRYENENDITVDDIDPSVY